MTLQNGFATHFHASPLISMRTESLASSQSGGSVDTDAWCERALNAEWISACQIFWLSKDTTLKKSRGVDRLRSCFKRCFKLFTDIYTHVCSNRHSVMERLNRAWSTWCVCPGRGMTTASGVQGSKRGFTSTGAGVVVTYKISTFVQDNVPHLW